MRALLSKAPGGPDALEWGDIAAPRPGPGQVLIEVRACSINFPDLLIIEDQYQHRPPRPFAPGSEIAGVVRAAADDVKSFSPGDRVVAQMNAGGLAEFAVAEAAWCAKLPDHRPFVESASLILTYGTALHALVDRGRLAAGETLLVLGASGGLGLAAIELGRAIGARVFAGVSSPSKAQAARAAGAEDVVVYGEEPVTRDTADAFKRMLGPGGADVIFDPVGGDLTEAAVRAIGWDGRLLVVGFAGGIPRLPLNLLLMKRCQATGVFWGPYAERFPERLQAHLTRLFQLWDEGLIAPRTGKVFPFAAAAEALSEMKARRSLGRLVVEVSHE